MKRLFCGVMSGSSLDGADAAIVAFDTIDGQETFELLSCVSVPFSQRLKHDIMQIALDKTTVSGLVKAHFELVNIYEDAILQAARQANIDLKSIEAVGLHGQTVWHNPPVNSPSENEKLANERLADEEEKTIFGTLQIGSGSALAARLGIPVVSDFRSADIALGGQGAPLVPIFDRAFFRHETQKTIMLNIGGIANISVLQPHRLTLRTENENEEVLGFDTGPGNMLIDMACRKFFGKQFDENGIFARVGRLIPRLFTTLQRDTFITQLPPKSTGREWYNEEYFEDAIAYNYFDFQPPEDALRTITEFTAWSIAENIRLFVRQNSPHEHVRVIVSGGGARNLFLMELLEKYISDATIRTLDDCGLPAQAKEAVAFAYLAMLRLDKRPGNIPSVTGAKRDVILGSVSV